MASTAIVILSLNVAEVTIDALNAEVQAAVGEAVELPEELETAVGEMFVFHNHGYMVPC